MSDDKKSFSLTVLGSRGSMAVTGKDKIKYGCGTSSYLVEAGDEIIILDAGSGIMSLEDLHKKKMSLLISHAHIDHIMGLPMFLTDFMVYGGKELWIYGQTRAGMPIKQQLELYMREPLWPIGFDKFPINQEFRGVSASFPIGKVRVTTMESNHPGGSTIYGLEFDGKKIVYATDFEHGSRNAEYKEEDSSDIPAFKRLAEFSKGADLILYDAQYTPSEYEKCRGFGHSTYVKALELYELSEARNMLLVHHAPIHTDDFMDQLGIELEKAIASLPHAPRGNIHFAVEGERIWL